MNTKLQRLCAWSGFAAMTVFFLGLIVATFFPPISPGLTAEQVAEYYQTHQLQILVGSLILIISAAFAGPFAAAIFCQLSRMEGQRPVCSMGQFASGIANIAFFILPGVLFAAMAYRPDRNVDALYAMHDIAWMVTMFPWTVGAMQVVCVGAAVLIHGSATTVYPRWVGFFCMWIALGMTTSSVIIFFKIGPFAWDGIVGFWIPATVFGLWFGVMSWMTVKAVNGEAVEEASPGTVGASATA